MIHKKCIPCCRISEIAFWFKTLEVIKSSLYYDHVSVQNDHDYPQREGSDLKLGNKSSTLLTILHKQENKGLTFNHLQSFIWEQSKYYKGRSNNLKSNLIQQKLIAEIGMLKFPLIIQSFRYIYSDTKLFEKI